jgi:importin subunit beta-1
MNALVDDLKNSTIHRSVKPPVLSCFGDIAMAIGAGYQPYLDFSMMMLMQAAVTTVPADDDDLVEFLNLLRESVLEAYVGIIQGLRDGNLLQLFGKYVAPVMQFLEVIATDPNRDDFVLSKAVGLLGDLAQTVGLQIKGELSRPFVHSLLQAGSQSSDQTLQETTQWAGSVIAAILQS